MIKKTTTLIALAGILALTTTLAFASPKPQGEKHCPENNDSAKVCSTDSGKHSKGHKGQKSCGSKKECGPKKGCGPRGGVFGKAFKKGCKLVHRLKNNPDSFGLSAEQKTKVTAIINAHMKNSIQLKADCKVLAIDLETAADAEKIDMPAVAKIMDQMLAKKKAVTLACLKTYVELKALLTPEQLKTLN